LDIELICCINNQHSNWICDIMISAKMLTPRQFPTNWQAYLDYVLGIEARVCNLSSTMHNWTQGSLSSKPADAMDIDTVCKAEKKKKPMNAEQHKWFDNSMCIHCSLHTVTALAHDTTPNKTKLLDEDLMWRGGQRGVGDPSQWEV
jgi:hypothetical protein